MLDTVLPLHAHGSRHSRVPPQCPLLSLPAPLDLFTFVVSFTYLLHPETLELPKLETVLDFSFLLLSHI